MTASKVDARPDTQQKQGGKNMKITLTITIELNTLPLEVAPVEEQVAPVEVERTQTTLEAFVAPVDGRIARPHGWSPTYAQGRAVHCCKNCGAPHRRISQVTGFCKDENCHRGFPVGPAGWV